MFITNAIALRGDRKRRHAFHETRGEPAQAAVAERGVRLDVAQLAEINAEILERRTKRRHQGHVGQSVGQQASDQELERQIIDALVAMVVSGTIGLKPLIDDPVAQRQRRRDIPVMGTGALDIFSCHQNDLGQHRALDVRDDVIVFRFGPGRCVIFENTISLGREFKDHP